MDYRGMRVKTRQKFIVGVVSFVSLTSLALSAVNVSASASTSSTQTSSTQGVVSVRSFPKQASTDSRGLFIEATAVDVSADADWGGIESLSVPKTKTPEQIQAEKDAAAAAAAKKAADEEAARVKAAQEKADKQTAASRSAARPQLYDIPASASGSAVASYAVQFVGAPYVPGGTTPAGWDCSGFTAYVFSHFGISLPHNDYSQSIAAAAYQVATPAPGDLMRKPGHVAIYIGNGMLVEAANQSAGTRITSISYASNWTYYRLVK